MLEELHIQNFAIIDDLAACFGPGLNVLTGETGAGKSILIGAIQLLLGARGRIDQIREGADEALVEGRFDLSSHPRLSDVLESHGFGKTDQVILRRVVSSSGKSRAYVNGQFCTLHVLNALGRAWVNIYGQHEHQSLLQTERHLDLLDAYGGLDRVRDRWDRRWGEWESLNSEIAERESQKEQTEKQRDLWAFQCEEIEKSNLRPAEEDDLQLERQRLLHARRIQEGLQRAEDALYAERGSAMERVHGVIREMQELASVDPVLQGPVETLNEAALLLEDSIQRIRELAPTVEPDPQRLQMVEERLTEIERLKRKYRKGIPELLSLAEDLRTALTELDRGAEDLEDLSGRRRDAQQALLALGETLSGARKEWGRVLSEAVERELRDLGIECPVFCVDSTPLTEGEPLGPEGKKAGPRGMDRVAFLLSTNVGESPRPLSRIASGGELSRIMLAMKKALAEAERVPTLIFDEIDAGIGGAVAQALGEKLAHIARGHQVLCITHLPQIARYAGTHFRVEKEIQGGRTVTRVQHLESNERVEEVSRMLGGKVITEQTRAHARELLSGSA
jgi:DNA repair protein RecN (Recombination protein N)